MYKNVIFDADGTLLDTLPGIYTGFNYALTELGKPSVTLAEVKPFMGPSLRDSFHLSLGLTEKETTQAVKLYQKFYRDVGFRMCEFFPKIKALLERLKSDGKKLCVATNKPQPFIDIILKEKGVCDYFDVIAGAELKETSTDKTPLVKKAALDISAVMVGDRYVDILAAKNAGVDSIGVLWGSAQDGEFIKYPPTYIAKDPEDVYRMIKE